MKAANFKAKFGNEKGNGELGLEVVFLQEGKSVIAYAPGLDISTSGKTVEDAKKRFSEIARMFIEDLVENNTLGAVLLSLGWHNESSNNNNIAGWVPPQKIISNEEIRVPVAV